MVAVKWIRAFLNGVQGNMVRVLLWVYAGIGPLASMVSVASSWRAGGFFVLDKSLCRGLPRSLLRLMKRQSGSSLMNRLRSRLPRL